MRILTALCLAAALPLLAQHEKDGEKPKHPFIGDLKAIEAGRTLFANGCAACHSQQVGQSGTVCDVVLAETGTNPPALIAALLKGPPATGEKPAAQPNMFETEDAKQERVNGGGVAVVERLERSEVAPRYRG